MTNKYNTELDNDIQFAFDTAIKLIKVAVLTLGAVLLWTLSVEVSRVSNELVVTQRRLISITEFSAHKLSGTMNKFPDIASSGIATLDRRLASVESKVDKALKSTNETVVVASNKVLERADRMLDLAEESVNQVKPILDVANVAAQNTRPYVDCSRNKGCMQATVVETLNAARAASRDVSRLAFTMNGQVPEIVKSSVQIADSIEKSSIAVAHDLPVITNNVNEISESIKNRVKIHWYDRLIGWAVNGLLAYGVTK